MAVPLELFNNASKYLGSKPHDAVDLVMTNIADFITLVNKQATEAVAQVAPTPAVAAAPETELAYPPLDNAESASTVVTDESSIVHPRDY